MSLDIWFEVDAGGPERITIFDANITHNLRAMWDLAGVDEALYYQEGKQVESIIPALEMGVAFMLAHPEECSALDAANGWGTYEHALPWLQKVLAAAKRMPKAYIQVSR